MGDRADFFVSHAGAERAWAEWVAWQLTDAGYTVELAMWDWAAGRNVVLAMSDALARCDRVLALFSAAYFDRSRYTTEEWTAALLHGPGRDQGRLVPESCRRRCGRRPGRRSWRCWQPPACGYRKPAGSIAATPVRRGTG